MNVGLVAHDGKKNLMQNLCIAYQDILKKHKLYATSTTGQMIEDVDKLKDPQTSCRPFLAVCSKWDLRSPIMK